jgi:hypothetical protein
MQSVISTRKSISVSLVVLALLTLVVGVASAKGFTHAPVIDVDGVDYYMAGAPDGPGGATDIPGHEWVQSTWHHRHLVT